MMIYFPAPLINWFSLPNNYANAGWNC